VCNAPVLRLPDFTRPFRVTTDASKLAFGMMLSQLDDNGKEYAVAIESHRVHKFKQ
jgi:hypothetical protein